MARKRQTTSNKQTAKKRQKTEEVVTVVLLSSSEDDTKKVQIDEECSIVDDDIPDEIFIVEDKCLPADPQKAKKIKAERKTRKSRRPCSSDEDWQDKPSTSKACRLPTPKATQGISKTRPRRTLTPAAQKTVDKIFSSDDESDSESKRRKKSPIIKIERQKSSKPIHPFFTPPLRKKEGSKEKEKLPEKCKTMLPEIENLEIETFPETMPRADDADPDVNMPKREEQRKIDQTENRDPHVEKPDEMPVLKERIPNKIAAKRDDSKIGQSPKTDRINEQSDDKKAKEELRRKIKEEKRIKEEKQKIKNEGRNDKENMPIKDEDHMRKESDDENVHIETPLDSTPPVQVSHSTDNDGENFVERVPEKIEIDPSKKRNIAFAQRPSSSENDETSSEEDSEEDDLPFIKEEKPAMKKDDKGFFSDVLHKVFREAKKGDIKKESIKTEPNCEKKGNLPSTSSGQLLRQYAMRQLESSDEEEESIYNHEESDSDNEQSSFIIKSEKENRSSKSPTISPNVSLDDTVMDKIFDQNKKKRRSVSGGSSNQSVSRQSSAESITVDEEKSPEKPQTRARGRPKETPKAKPKPKKLTVPGLKINDAKKKATPKRLKDETFDLKVYLPSHDEWKTLNVAKSTKASTVIAYIRHDVPGFENKKLALFYFDPVAEADDPFLESKNNMIYENENVELLQFKMGCNNKSLKILVQETIEINVPSIVKESASNAVTKPKKKNRVVQSFHIVFQRGEGRDNEIKAFGDENMTLSALFAKTNWQQENVKFEFDGDEYPSDTIVKNIEDCESGIIIEIHYDTPEADPETEPGADPEADPVVAQE